MSTFGTLTDYTTGTAIRPATANEWRKTADMLNADYGDSYTGAWKDEGRVVYVDGGPEATVSDDDIRALRDEAMRAGDAKQFSLCNFAVGEDDISDPTSWDAWLLETPTQEDARAKCVRVILDNRANVAADA